MAGAVADAIVVGGGTSGAVLAARLSEDPDRRILLLEAGPDHDGYDERVHDPRRALELFGGGGVADPFTMDGIVMVRGRALGGTSTVNFMAAVRPKPSDLDAWRLPGWTWADLAPLYDRVEAVLDVQPWDGLSRAAEAFLDGVPGAEILRTARHPDGRRRTVSQAYLTDDVRRRPNLEIRTGTTVERVVDRGVRTASGEELRSAGEVFVCCGATRTPPLLQRSGIDCGDGLQDHLGVSATYRHPGSSGSPAGPAQVLWDGGDVHLIPTVVADDGTTTYVTVLAFLLDLDDRGSVRGEDIRPQRRDARDVARLAATLQRLRAWEETPAFAALGLQRLGDLPDPAAAPLVSYGHQSGTCAMGAVLDPACRVVGVEGLRVVDASSFPRLVSGPPYLTCVVLAERVAELVRDQGHNLS